MDNDTTIRNEIIVIIMFCFVLLISFVIVVIPPKINPIKNMVVRKKYFSKKKEIILLNRTIPINIPIPSSDKNKKFFSLLSKKLVSADIALSYRLKLIISTAPLNPGIILAMPIIIPFIMFRCFILYYMN